MIANKLTDLISDHDISVYDTYHDLFSTEYERNQHFGLSGLSRFVYQDLFESQVAQARITSTNTCRADDMRGLQYLSFSAALQRLVSLLILC